MNVRVSALKGLLSGSLSSWLRDRRGSTSVEFVIGSVLIATATVGGLDLYRAIGTRSLALHAANTMADYVSLEAAPSKKFIEDLAAFSYRKEIAQASKAAFVVSAVSRDVATDEVSDPPVVQQWSHEIAIGENPESPPVAFGRSCGRAFSELADEKGALHALGMQPGEMVLLVEVCVMLPSGAFVSGPLLADNLFPKFFYQHHIFPVRGDHMPEDPSPPEDPPS